MAIKERKQITGTTAQIDAYEGHEGQIVWDKDKKTFVGMSGTAGKNYPLAPKEYVDKEVAKCLPLTGGQVTGDIRFGTGAIISGMSQDGKFRELILGSDAQEDPSGNSGASLALRNSGGSNESLRGSFALITRLANTTMPYILEGKTNGDLTWGGQNVEAITSRSGGWNQGCIRYASGIQICWLINVLTNAAGGVSFSFPAPFASAPYVVASLQGSSTSLANWSFVYDDHTGGGKTGTNIWLMSNGAVSPSNNIRCFAFGFWK